MHNRHDKVSTEWAGVQEDPSDVVASVARKFLTAMSMKPGTRNDRDKLWQKIETIVDSGSENGKQLGYLDVPRTTSVLWASAGGALHPFGLVLWLNCYAWCLLAYKADIRHISMALSLKGTKSRDVWYNERNDSCIRGRRCLYLRSKKTSCVLPHDRIFLQQILSASTTDVIVCG
jgi:hypothetical protein